MMIQLLAGHHSLLGQKEENKLRVYYEHENEATTCTVVLEDLMPIIDFDNPYFYNRSWNAEKKIEKAMVTPERTLVVGQFGCIRHHVSIDYIIAAPVAKAEDPAFYATELIYLLRKIYYGQYHYSQIRQELEQTLRTRIKEKGLGTLISFPMAEFTVRCQLENDKGTAKAHLELIRYVHKERIAMPGIPEYKDDGHFKPMPTK
jgi:hypothetical protein